ncbi:hypothetical protein VTK56DRAFT_6234 [Thermocarpiscus australiensis]
MQTGKRKLLSDSNDPVRKRRRQEDPPNTTQGQDQTQGSTSRASPYSQVYSPLLDKLKSKFEVKTMSVMPSTSISKHVDRALEHLGRFSAWDRTVLPGVVLLCSKSAASSKLITISELVRRRIGESGQKWYQYNVLSETVWEEAAAARPAEELSVVEDTFMVAAADREGEEGSDDDYFEAIQPTIHEQAVEPVRVRYKAHMMVLLSRVPLHELETGQNVSLQTNEQQIEYLRKKNMGLVG